MEKTCPDQHQLALYSSGACSESDAVSLSAHVERCFVCNETIQRLEDATDPFVNLLRKTVSTPDDQYLKEAPLQQALSEVAALSLFRPKQADSAMEAVVTDLVKVGDRLREYQLLQVLGRGGMGVVFRARHEKLGREVALKVLSAAATQNASMLDRFEREMQAVGRLDHPNIVRASDAGEFNGIHFLVMDYVEGPNLSQLLKTLGPLPVADACELVRQAAVGLQDVHEHGLVHRDLKPGNLMLTRAGIVKILDLGLARLHTDPLAAGDLTATGQLMGTIDYMSPEQAENTHEVDIRADIYSLGATLFALLSGHAPFAGDRYSSALKRLVALASQTPDRVDSVRSDVPAELADLVARLLAKRPDDRPAMPYEVAEVLAPLTVGHNTKALYEEYSSTDRVGEHIVEATRSSLSTGSALAETHISIPAEQPSIVSVEDSPAERRRIDRLATEPAPKPEDGNWRGEHRRWFIGAGFAALFVLTAILFRFKTDDGTVVVELDGTIEIAAVEIDKHKVSFTPDASRKQLTFQVDPGKHSITITTADGLELVTSLGEKPLEIKTGDTAKLRAWLEPNKAAPKRDAPTSIATGMKPNVQSAEPHPASNTVDSLSPFTELPKLGTWEPFGTADVDKQYPTKSILGAETLPGLALRPAKLEGIRRWNVDAKLPRTFGGFAKFSPDGQYIALKNNTGHARIYDAETLELSVLIPSIQCRYSSLDWSPDSQSIVFAQENSAIQRWSIDGKLLWDSSSAQTDNNFLNVQFSPDGKILASIRENDIVLWVNEGSMFVISKVIESPTTLIGAISWSPDGESFVVSDSKGSLIIFTRDGEQRNRIEGTSSFTHSQILNRLHWSPQGDWIGFIDTIHPTEVQRFTPEGKLGSPVKVAEQGSAYFFAWSPDGKQVYASGLNLATTTNIETGEIRQIPGEFNPNFIWFDVSQDGTKILSCRLNGMCVFDSSLKLKSQKRLETVLIDSSAWNQQGTHFVSAGGDGARLWTSLGRAIVVPGTQGDRASLFAWQPNGKSLAMSRLYTRDLLVGDPTKELKEISPQQYERISWSGNGEYFVAKLQGQNTLEIFSDQGAPIGTLDFDSSPAFAFAPIDNFLAVCVGTTLFTCSPDDDWQLHKALTLNRKSYDFITWSHDGQFLAIKSSALLRYANGSFSVVNEEGGINDDEIDLSASGAQIVGAWANRLRLSDSTTGTISHEKLINTHFIRSVNWHPSRDLFTTGHDDSTFAHWDAKLFEPYWLGVQLPDNQSLAITAAGQILAGDGAVVDEQLVYYIETEDGQIKLLTPSEFETLIGESIYAPQSSASRSDQGEGQGLSFDGIDDCVEIDFSNLDIARDEKLTIELWVQAARVAKSDQALVRLATQPCYMLSIEAEDEGGDWDASWYVVDETARLHSNLWRSRTPVTDRWTHLAAVFDYADSMGQPTLYIDGTKKGDARIASQQVKPAQVLGKLFIGAQEPGREHFQGRVRQVRISRGLRYEDSFTPPDRFEADPDTIALYDFTADNAREVLDLSDHGHHGTIHGAAR